MEVENDLIKREIQRLNLLLTSLIEKISGLNLNNATSGIEETNETLKTEFDLTLLDITEMQNSELLKRITELHESHTEKLAELIYEIVIKEELPELCKNYDKEELAKKGILIVDFLNDKSKTFSMKRMKIKNALQHCV